MTNLKNMELLLRELESSKAACESTINAMQNNVEELDKEIRDLRQKIEEAEREAERPTPREGEIWSVGSSLCLILKDGGNMILSGYCGRHPSQGTFNREEMRASGERVGWFEEVFRKIKKG